MESLLTRATQRLIVCATTKALDIRLSLDLVKQLDLNDNADIVLGLEQVELDDFVKYMLAELRNSTLPPPQTTHVPTEQILDT